MSKKKKKSSIPRDARLNRTSRLLKAKQWITSYDGKNLVKGYARHYHTDLLCAITELRMLGIDVSSEYEAAIRRSMADRFKQKQLKAAPETKEGYLTDWDDEFSFIAGYTDGGAPYGTRWDETNDVDYRDDEYDRNYLDSPPDDYEWAEFNLVELEPPPDDLVILAYLCGNNSANLPPGD